MLVPYRLSYRHEMDRSDITKNIEINNIPFVYYLDMSSIPSDYDIQYKFLNENGEEIQ